MLSNNELCFSWAATHAKLYMMPTHIPYRRICSQTFPVQISDVQSDCRLSKKQESNRLKHFAYASTRYKMDS